MAERFAPLDRVLARERFAAQVERRMEQRKDLLSAAYWAALREREATREKLRTNAGLWLPEFSPLTPHERTELIKKLRHDLGLPVDPRMRKAEGPVPSADKPDLVRPA